MKIPVINTVLVSQAAVRALPAYMRLKLNWWCERRMYHDLFDICRSKNITVADATEEAVRRYVAEEKGK